MFATHFIIGALLSCTIGVWVGRKMTTYGGGVPTIPYRKVHDFPNVDPTFQVRRRFRRFFFATIVAGGYLFATFTINSDQVNDIWYNRPEFRPFPAMVAKEDLDITE